jgi:hypothetical protein
MVVVLRRIRGPGGAKSRAAAVEARKKQADARAARLAPVAGLWASGATSWDDIAKPLNARGIPTTAGHGKWEPKAVRRMMARLK